MIYDEEPSAVNFYKKIVHMQTATVVPNKDKLQMVISEESNSVKVTIFFRDSNHFGLWKTALEEIKRGTRLPTQQ